jgi:hypothetical protein
MPPSVNPNQYKPLEISNKKSKFKIPKLQTIPLNLKLNQKYKKINTSSNPVNPSTLQTH